MILESEGEDHGGQELSDADFDPHVWLNPLRAQKQAERITAALVTADPDGALEFVRNSDGFEAELRGLDEQIARQLTNCALDTAVVSHLAYGHMAERYGFNQLGLAGLSPEFESGPSHIASVIRQIDELGIRYILQEPIASDRLAETVAAEAGVEEVIIVTSPGKESISGYFQPKPDLEQRLESSGETDLLAKVVEAAGLAKVSFVLQHEALGLGHAVLMAKDAVGNEPFVVILPDDIIAHTPGAISQMVQVSSERNAGVIAVEVVPWEVVHNYGVVDATQVSERVHKIQGLVEKPPRDQAPSNLTIVGRYILPPQIFEALENTPPGAKGEIQLTDGLLALLKEHELFAYEFAGVRFDGGTPMGLLRASLAFALNREDTSKEAAAMLREFQDKS